MDNTKVLVWDKSQTIALTQFVGLVAVATVVPLFHQQLITGPVVNATLFVATILLGTSRGMLVGLIPSLIALSVGTLPAALAPMVPFIMTSNALLILVFNSLKSKNFWLAIGVSSLVKFFFLYGTSFIVINLLMKKELAASVAIMMSWPQLITALAGGVLAGWFLSLYRAKD